MFMTAPGKPTKAKKAVYLAAATALGVFLSLLAHAAIESVYLDWAGETGRTIVWSAGCSLHPLIQLGLLFSGGLGGFGLGRRWWRMIYIDRALRRG